jgi:dihydrofolate reductase
MHVVSSLDGFIARKDNSVSWMDGNGSVYEAGVSISEEEVAGFVLGIDCYLLGSRTYEHALELGWPYGDTPAVVVTSRRLPLARKNVEFYSGIWSRWLRCGAPRDFETSGWWVGQWCVSVFSNSVSWTTSG